VLVVLVPVLVLVLVPVLVLVRKVLAQVERMWYNGASGVHAQDACTGKRREKMRVEGYVSLFDDSFVASVREDLRRIAQQHAPLKMAKTVELEAIIDGVSCEDNDGTNRAVTGWYDQDSLSAVVLPSGAAFVFRPRSGEVGFCGGSLVEMAKAIPPTVFAIEWRKPEEEAFVQDDRPSLYIASCAGTCEAA
jgi:hypothetical protein